MHVRLERERDGSLEAIRGIAALIVVAWHSLLGFYPEHSGIFRSSWPDREQFTDHIWFGLFNGTAAVTVFFVLSGYVLTRKYFESGDDGILIRGALKRWPRLMGPVLIVVLASYFLFITGAYRFESAAKLTGSDW